MNKKIIFGAILTLGLALFAPATPTFAEDYGVMPLTNDNEAENTTNTTDTINIIECSGNEFYSYCSNEFKCELNAAGEEICAYVPFSEEKYRCNEIENMPGQRLCWRLDNMVENVIDEGTSGEAEVVCADPDEPGCKEETEVPLWPCIISISAIVATLAVIVVLNLFGRKK